MFKFVDGMPVLLNFAQLESMYYRAFIDRFQLDEQAVSITQWRGSYEYQAIYPEIQLMLENGVIMSDSLDHVMGTIAEENEAIYRPAALQTRVSERFKQEGYEATIRVADINTRGIVAICVDQERDITARNMTVGVTGAVGSERYGFDSTGTPFGSIDNGDYKGAVLDAAMTLPGGGTGVQFFMQPATFTEESLSVIFHFDGKVRTFAYQFNEGDEAQNFRRYHIDDATLYQKFVDAYNGANTGSGAGILQFSFADENTAINNDDSTIGNLIRDELLPAGQFIEGSVAYDTALSNGQAVTIRWTTPREYTNLYRVTITKLRNTQHPIDTPEAIISMFNATYASMMGIGLDITPARYLTTDDLPWAASVVVEFEKGDGSGGTFWTSEVYPVAFTDRHLANLPPENVIIQ